MSNTLYNRTSWQTHHALSSDHLPIMTTINIRHNFRLQSYRRTFTNYKKANWTQFTKDTELAFSQTTIPDDIHTANRIFTNIILLADKHNIPKGKMPSTSRLLPEHIVCKITQRDNIRRANPWGFSPKRLIILQKKAVRTISLSRYLSHSTPLFKNLKILKIDDQYSIQLYKLYYKNTNNLLPSYFNSFTPYYNNEEHSHNLRSMTLRLPMTRREFFVQSTKYQLLKLVRETSVIDLNRTVSSTIYQFSAFFKYSIINRYDPICTIDHCYVCG